VLPRRRRRFRRQELQEKRSFWGEQERVVGQFSAHRMPLGEASVIIVAAPVAQLRHGAEQFAAHHPDDAHDGDEGHDAV
jgi:hypothetical protein